jgi:NAD(P)H dehydrogenase (quinone)
MHRGAVFPKDILYWSDLFMILLTGAAGKTGRAILRELVARQARVCVLAHTHEQADQLKLFGAEKILYGDIQNKNIIEQSISGIEKIYHICPNVSPDEFAIGKLVVSAAKRAGVSHFVYHSVLHPQVEAMPHHWQKMRMEEELFASGMDFTILQPCAYMQNILAGWKNIIEQSMYSVPYSVNARISMVDLKDVGSAAAEVLCTDEYRNGIFELSGPQALSQVEVAETIGKVLDKPIRAVQQDLAAWVSNARNSGMSDYQVESLAKMFDYYDNYGLVGNPGVLKTILGRSPRTLADFTAWYNQSSRKED